MNNLPKKQLRLGIAAAAVIALILVLAFSAFGVDELTQFNSRSMMDWRLGGSIDGVRSTADAEEYDTEHFEFFTAENGEGISPVGTDTRYFLGSSATTIGRYRVTGFSSSESTYSVLGIRVGDDELDSKTELLDLGYKMNGGGHNECIAVKGHIVVVLKYEHGFVTNIGAYLN